MELGGGGWSWVKVGARFSNTRTKLIRKIIKIFDTFLYLRLGLENYCFHGHA